MSGEEWMNEERFLPFRRIESPWYHPYELFKVRFLHGMEARELLARHTPTQCCADGNHDMDHPSAAPPLLHLGSAVLSHV